MVLRAQGEREDWVEEGQVTVQDAYAVNRQGEVLSLHLHQDRAV